MVRFKRGDLVYLSDEDGTPPIYAYILKIYGEYYEYMLINTDWTFYSYAKYEIDKFHNEVARPTLVRKTKEIKEKLADLILSVI